MRICLAFDYTVLTFEPRNAIILDYQATLAQYINNGEKRRKGVPSASGLCRIRKGVRCCWMFCFNYFGTRLF